MSGPDDSHSKEGLRHFSKPDPRRLANNRRVLMRHPATDRALREGSERGVLDAYCQSIPLTAVQLSLAAAQYST